MVNSKNRPSLESPKVLMSLVSHLRAEHPNLNNHTLRISRGSTGTA
jgi:hypothetical protein